MNEALHLDYFRNTTNQTLTSMPNTTNTSTTKKTLISSKHHSNNQHCLDIRRKPVKGCYCSELKKIQQKSIKTQSKSCTSRKCKSHILPAIVIENNYEKSTISSPISCETLRRVQKIDYVPKSQFLRNVRSKISLLQSAAGDCPQICSRSQCYHELMTKKDIYSPPCICESIDQLKTDNKIHDLTKSKVNEKYSSSETIEKSDKGIQVSLRKESKSLSSTSVPCVPNITICNIKKTEDKISEIKCQCQKENSKDLKNDLEKKDNADSEKCGTKFVKKSLDKIEQKHLSDKEMRDLNKFREKNYFDTHGSNDILVSSKSSGSLEQYFLNERLFPERSRNIHKKDLVVTMPPCVTTQLKRIHYFPRYIVHQEKNNFNTTCKKKRCQTCPLTGHAIDLGITKIKVPLNSLALKYQKRLP